MKANNFNVSFRTSALTGENVTEAFNTLITEAIMAKSNDIDELDYGDIMDFSRKLSRETFRLTDTNLARKATAQDGKPIVDADGKKKCNC
jgi:hypothetical protein